MLREAPTHGFVTRRTLRGRRYVLVDGRGRPLAEWLGRRFGRLQRTQWDAPVVLLDDPPRTWWWFAGETVPAPPFWGGYRVVPDEVELWQGRPDRSHDRFVYRRDDADGWRIERLQP